MEPRKIEQKWQKKWKDSHIFSTDFTSAKKPFFTHVMFPYPSGDRLHMGHVYNFSLAHSYARYKRLQGYDVYEPMGFDSFGLPAENYAIKTGIHPAESTQANINTMIEQLTAMGNVYDWGSQVATHHPSYYQWTQWVFLQLYTNDLIYKKEAEVNWDPVDQTVLANEQVLPDGTAERSGAIVEKRNMPQWFARVTNYADELLEEGEKLDWPNKTKIMQRNWIGKSEGCQFTMKIVNKDNQELGEIEVFTTRIDTVYGMTYAVIAPGHENVSLFITDEHKNACDAYIEETKNKSDIERAQDDDKTGVFTGNFVINPFNDEKLPLWIGDYVLASYGTGAVMAVPAHDKRDFKFYKKYKNQNIRIKCILSSPYAPDKKNGKSFNCTDQKKFQEYIDEHDDLPEFLLVSAGDDLSPYKICNSDTFSGYYPQDARKKITEYAEINKFGKYQTQYRLRDWCLSRQRYWGAPIPIVYDPDGNAHPIPQEHLPWTLPTDVEFKPTGTSPLAESKELHERVEKIFGAGWTPEYDTMDTFVCSSFYSYRFLAYGDDQNFVDNQIEKKWMPVDFYCGGSEHACMHLIYARFVTKALADLGHVSHREPFKRLFHQGMITRNGAKISKRSNPLSPDEWIEKYGSDVLRMYLMFMGPFDQGGDWNDRGISGTQRFIKKIYRMVEEKYDPNFEDDAMDVLREMHKSIKKVGEDIEKLHFNTALASLMETMNMINKQEKVSKEIVQQFLIILSPMAPHLTEELWERIGNTGFIIEQSWPEYNPAYLQSDTVTIAVQVCGKLRGSYEFTNGVTKEEVIETVYDEPNIAKWLEGKTILKEIFIPNKILNIVVK